ncbi:MAG TPA: MdtA/MuxA family multidrug efflux RND transporter periplasmic adaptor subunit [Opitutaceae bacterium]|nr:MdtA/MuxA family multidrug efflux RND transporter periplasmic adaptor subunit [Opitutaceae bacterium]
MNKPPAAQPPSSDAAKTSAPSVPRGGVPPARTPRRRTPVIIVSIVVVLLATVWWINHREAARGPGSGAPGGRGGRFAAFRGGPNAPLPVTAKAAVKGDIPIYLNALGTVTPAHIATIRTQISGQLQQINFQEGQFVQQGALLAVIDPRPYENALAQAQAQLQQAQAQLKTVQLDLQRYETLAKEDSIASQQVDNTRSQVNQYEGLVASAKSAIATANLNLTYCHIRAPFAGRVGLRQVDTGNYVTPGDANGIVVLTQTKPITVIFTLPEENMGRVAARLQGGAKLPVDAFDRSQTKIIASGTLDSMDNQIDPTTGTFKLRAMFTNEDESLFANEFVNVRLLLDTVHDAIVIPSAAIERGPEGTYVYVISPDQTAVARNVTLGDTEGEIVAITSGLKLGEQVVTDGADKLKDGQKVILGGAAPNWGAAGAAGGEPGKWGQRPAGAEGGKAGRGKEGAEGGHKWGGRRKGGNGGDGP